MSINADRLLTLAQRIVDGPEAIRRIRRFVLDVAVRGQLVPQDPTDEPVSALLARVQREKERLIRAGECRDKRPHPPVAEDEAPFRVPATWQWVRLAHIADFSAGRTPSRNDSSFWDSSDYPWVSIADMQDGQVLTATKESVSRQAKAEVFGSEPEAPGTIIMSFKLTIGKIARLGIPAFHNEAIVSIRPFDSELDAFLFLMLPQFARSGDTKGAIKGATLNRDSLSNILLPCPPLPEQRRIVDKVRELATICDQIELSISDSIATRRRLLDAVLAEALDSAYEGEPEPQLDSTD